MDRVGGLVVIWAVLFVAGLMVAGVYLLHRTILYTNRRVGIVVAVQYGVMAVVGLAALSHFEGPGHIPPLYSLLCLSLGALALRFPRAVGLYGCPVFLILSLCGLGLLSVETYLGAKIIVFLASNAVMVMNAKSLQQGEDPAFSPPLRQRPIPLRDGGEEYEDPCEDWLGARCVRQDGAMVPASKLYEDYRAWCESEFLSPMAQAEFEERLGQEGFTSGLRGETRVWERLRLRPS